MRNNRDGPFRVLKRRSLKQDEVMYSGTLAKCKGYLASLTKEDLESGIIFAVCRQQKTEPIFINGSIPGEIITLPEKR